MTVDPREVANQVGPAREDTLTELREIARLRQEAHERMRGASTEHFYTLIRLAHKLGVRNTELEQVTGLSKVQVSKIISRRGVAQ